MQADPLQLVGRALTGVSQEGATWCFLFAGSLRVATESPWRFVKSQGIFASSEDRLDRAVVSDADDPAQLVMSRLAGLPVTSLSVESATRDLTLRFAVDWELQFLNLLALHQGWRFLGEEDSAAGKPPADLRVESLSSSEPPSETTPVGVKEAATIDNGHGGAGCSAPQVPMMPPLPGALPPWPVWSPVLGDPLLVIPSTKTERIWAAVIHVSGVVGFGATYFCSLHWTHAPVNSVDLGRYMPGANVVLPLILWLIQREPSPFVRDQGRECVNFQISVSLALLASLLICCLAPFSMPLIWLYTIATCVVAAIKANQGLAFRHPLIWRVIT